MPEARQRRIASRVERWFEANKRPLPWRDRYDPYHVWISEVMAQQTRIEVVVRYFPGFVAAFPSIEALAAADEDRVTSLWSGLGYYRRARMLREGAIDVMRRFDGVLPKDVDELMTIPGVGRYTAGAIRSVAYELPAPAVDGNVIRLMARLEGGGSPWDAAGALSTLARSPRALTQGLMEIGSQICKPRGALCMECPLRDDCVAFATDRVHELPIRPASTKARSIRIALFLIEDSDGRVLMRREEGPLMRGLYHLPHASTLLLPATPLPAVRKRRLGKFRHSITTRVVEFEVIEAELAASSIRDSGDDYTWVDPAAMAQTPHPSYVAKALHLARNRGARQHVPPVER